MNIKKYLLITDILPIFLDIMKNWILKNILRNSSGLKGLLKNVMWLEFIERLKETGMPLEYISHYANLRDQSERALELKIKMLQQHALTLEANILKE